VLEVIGESINPGDIGSFEFGGRQPDRPNKSAILVRTVVLLVLGVALVVWAMAEGVAAHKLGYGLGGVAVYLLAGWTFRPIPDTGNMGWLGGLVDNPFRFSDDINRFLIFLKIFMFPGAFAADTFFDFAVFCCGMPDFRAESWEAITRKRRAQFQREREARTGGPRPGR
jgi:hypothetical protein